MRGAAVILGAVACGPGVAPIRVPPKSVAVSPPIEAVPLGKLPADVHPTHESLALWIDPRKARFGGTAELELDLDRPRDTIWLHGRGLAVSAVTATSAGATVTATYAEVDPIGVARVTLPTALRGHVVLSFTYDAAYDPSLVGAYRIGEAAVFTKFEAIYARRAFPCFDEPRFKIPFDVMLDVPADATVVGNMPPAMDLVMSGVHRVAFAPTPPLPTYLVAFAVGPFDVVAAKGKLPISGVAWRGRGKDLAFALAEEPALLAEQERYFGMAFPYPKLDLVAVPDFQSGAMENAGAITFRDSALLVDDAATSFAQRIKVISTLAHETVHQWFGDLVTMPWWDDLWLNEGFATFLATRTLRTVHPELEAELDALDDTDAVMDADSLDAARRIRQPIATTHDITNAFDGITYDKGAAVLTMLEHYLGDEPFRRGVHAFLTAHATGNATTDDLVAALARASGKPVAAVAASFLDRPGVPVVDVVPTCEAGRGRVHLAQARWQPIGGTLPGGEPWSIPVCLRTSAGETCTVFATRTATVELPACVGWVMPNAGAAGYYRFTLPAAALAPLRTANLSTVERLALGHDLAAAFRSGAIAGGDVLAALDGLTGDPQGTVASVPLETYRFVDRYVLDGKPRDAMRAHVARLYAPVVRALGWTATPTEPAWRRTFRPRLLEFLALVIEDKALLDEAARLGRRYLAGDTRAVDPDLVALALAGVARRGDAAVVDALIAKLVHADDAQLRQQILSALGNVRTPALVERALELSLDPRLHANERLTVLARLLQAIETRDAAWAWLGTHFDALVALLPDRYGGYLPSMLAACDPTRTAALATFFTPRVDALTGGPRNLANAIDAGKQCAALVAAQRGSVTGFAAGL